MSADRVRRGGVAGFFAREVYEIRVEVPDGHPALDAGAAPVEAAPAATALAAPTEMAGGPAPQAPVPAGPRPLRQAPAVASNSAPFEEVLRRLVDSVDIPVLPELGGPGADTVTADDADWGSAAEWLASAESEVEVEEAPAPPPVEVPAARPRRARQDSGRNRPARPVKAAPSPGRSGRTAHSAAATASARRPKAKGSTPAVRMKDELRSLGLPARLVPASTTADPAPALRRSLAKLPAAAPLDLEPGDVMAVVGPAEEASQLAGRIARSLGLDPRTVVHAAADGDVAGRRARIDSAESAWSVSAGWTRLSRPTIVAVATGRGSGAEEWAREVLEALEPATVWGVVEATRKPEDVVAWAEAVGSVDALAVEGCDDTRSPASVLDTGIPVAMVDGRPATAERWAAILADRLQAVS